MRSLVIKLRAGSGTGTSSPIHGETWEYDGAAWSHAPDFTPPNSNGSITFDSARSVMVACNGSPYSAELWQRTATGWQSISSDPPGPQIAFDSILGSPVALRNLTYNAPSGIWSFDAATGHTNVMNTGGPTISDGQSLVYDAAGHQLLAFGPGTLLARTDVTSGPIITLRPQGLSLYDHWWPGTFHVEATGRAPLTYQWRRNGLPLADGGPYSGATTPDLTITPSTWDAGGGFDVVIVDQCGPTTSPTVGVSIVCYINCDDSLTLNPWLNANDFQCFLNSFARGDSYANCDMSTSPPILNVNDFQCFMNRFALWCP